MIQKKKERIEKEKRVRWRGRGSKALLVLRFIADIISLISTLLVLVFRCNESVVRIGFARFL
jgi:hypothetical protein